MMIFLVLFTACDNSTVTITVGEKYENGIANKLATDKTYDEDGNIVYTFTKDQYLEYINELMEHVKTEFREEIADTATYSYLNENGTELVVGVDKSVYEEALCKKQAEKIGNLALLYNASTLDHTGKVTVIFEDSSTGIVYFKHNAVM